jgi:hypothetical protein
VVGVRLAASAAVRGAQTLRAGAALPSAEEAAEDEMSALAAEVAREELQSFVAAAPG